MSTSSLAPAPRTSPPAPSIWTSTRRWFRSFRSVRRPVVGQTRSRSASSPPSITSPDRRVTTRARISGRPALPGISASRRFVSSRPPKPSLRAPARLPRCRSLALPPALRRSRATSGPNSRSCCATRAGSPWESTPPPVHRQSSRPPSLSPSNPASTPQSPLRRPTGRTHRYPVPRTP